MAVLIKAPKWTFKRWICIDQRQSIVILRAKCYDRIRKEGRIIMLKSIVSIALMLCMFGMTAQATGSELLDIKAADGYVLEGKLDMPETKPERLVIFVNGSGPNTYDNRRQINGQNFNYFDLFAERITADGNAFFRWNTRGCAPGDEPPLFTDISEPDYQTYVPENSIADVEAVISVLRDDERLSDCPVILLGWSEGTMIAPQVAVRGNVPVDALVLCGYVNGTMAEALEWQQTGGASMVFYREYFDTDGDGAISASEYNADPYGIVKALGDVPFESLDLDGSGILTEEDFKLMLADSWSQLQDAIARGDDQWLAENYSVRLTSAWFEGHARLQPNREILSKLDIPIHIFHGISDGNVPVQGVYDIEASFQEAGKDNLTIHVYPNHDHDLNYTQYILTGELSEGFKDLFELLAHELS